MNDMKEMITLRQRFFRKRNRSATAQTVVTIVLSISLTANLVNSILIGATAFDMMQVILGTAMLALLWFYSATERYDPADLARALAGDLLISMATHASNNAIYKPMMHNKGSSSSVIIGLAPEQSGMLNVATRVARFRTEANGRAYVREGRVPRLTMMMPEYRFTPEDVSELVVSMAHDPQAIKTYRAILDLIDASEKGGRRRISKRRTEK